MPIRQALSKLVELLNSVDTPLDEMVAYLADTNSNPVMLDRRALQNAGLGADEPATINLREIQLRSPLRHILGDYELTYLINHEALITTAPEEAQYKLGTRVDPN